MQLASIKDVNFIVLHGEPNAGKNNYIKWVDNIFDW